MRLPRKLLRPRSVESMKRTTPLLLSTVLASLVLSLCTLPARADFELKDAEGRRILLRDDGTWLYLDANPPKAAAAPASAASEPADEKPPPMAELLVVGKSDTPSGCQFDLLLRNTLPYEIRSLVPEFGAIRTSGVTYTTQTAAFISLKPGDELARSVRFNGIKCSEVEKVVVQGGDRCVMGDLERYGGAKGACLARLKLLPTKLVRFEK
jgi:hypothetical protein